MNCGRKVKKMEFGGYCPYCGIKGNGNIFLHMICQDTKNLLKENVKNILITPFNEILFFEYYSLPHINSEWPENGKDLCLDLCSMPEIEDNSVDMMWISHVFEHIENEEKAMREVARVLKTKGKAYISFPESDMKTLECKDLKNNTAKERQKWLYDADHKRLYGTDTKERFEKVFKVEKINMDDYANENNLFFGGYICSGRNMYICSKK
jgi:predicted SAM-dependent methyltransferase